MASSSSSKSSSLEIQTHNLLRLSRLYPVDSENFIQFKPASRNQNKVVEAFRIQTKKLLHITIKTSLKLQLKGTVERRFIPAVELRHPQRAKLMAPPDLDQKVERIISRATSALIKTLIFHWDINHPHCHFGLRMYFEAVIDATADTADFSSS